MTSETPTIQLKECLSILKDGTHNPPPRSTEGVKFIAGATDIKYLDINFTKCTFVSQENYRMMHRKWEPEENDVLLTIVGTVGNTAIVKKQDLPFTMQRSIATLRANEKIDFRYLFYWLNSFEAKWAISSRITATGQPGIYLGELGKIPISIPALEVQRNISQRLYRLDQLIRANKKIVENIENQLRALFRSWFIDFDPVKIKAEGKLPYGMDDETAALFPDSFEDSELGPIPTGWKVKSLLEVSNLYDNLRVPLSSMERNERKGNYPYHGATSVMDYVDDFIFDGVHLLIAEDGSVVNEDGYPVLQYVWGKFWVNNHAHVLKGKDDFTTEHLHQYVKHFYIQPFVTGAVQLKINQKALHNVKLVIAPPNINNAFNEIIQPLYRSIRENKMKNEILTLTRDTLLPRLMSGELEVPMEA